MADTQLTREQLAQYKRCISWSILRITPGHITDTELQEILQDVLVTIYRLGYPTPAQAQYSPATWIHNVTRSRISLRAQERQSARYKLTDYMGTEADITAACHKSHTWDASGLTGPEQSLYVDEAIERLGAVGDTTFRAPGTLPTVIRMRMAGYTATEIGRAIGASQASVSRALKIAQEHYARVA